MSFLKCRYVKVINKPVRSRSIYQEVKDTKPKIIFKKKTEIKRSKRCDINVKINKDKTIDKIKRSTNGI